MKAIVVTDQAAGTAGMTLVERPGAVGSDKRAVVVEVHASGNSSRLSWRGPRPGPIAATVTNTVDPWARAWPEWSPPSAMARRGCRWDSGCSASRTGHRDGTLAEYGAVEARNLAPLPGDVDFTAGARACRFRG